MRTWLAVLLVTTVGCVESAGPVVGQDGGGGDTTVVDATDAVPSPDQDPGDTSDMTPTPDAQPDSPAPQDTTPPPVDQGHPDAPTPDSPAPDMPQPDAQPPTDMGAIPDLPTNSYTCRTTLDNQPSVRAVNGETIRVDCSNESILDPVCDLTETGKEYCFRCRACNQELADFCAQDMQRVIVHTLACQGMNSNCLYEVRDPVCPAGCTNANGVCD